MRTIDAKKLENIIKSFCDDSENYGVSDELNVSTKEIIDGGLKNIDFSKLKKWFKDVAIIGHFIDKTLFKSCNYCLHSNDLNTFGGASIPSRLIPNGLKIKLSKKDIQALYEVHQSIRDRTKEIKKIIYTNQNNASISTQDINTLSYYAMDIPQNIYKICNGHKY